MPRADIDLRPLTVFVGPSNTGKSYLAILIYALHRFFFYCKYSHGKWLSLHRGVSESLPSSRTLFADFSNELNELLDKLPSQFDSGPSSMEDGVEFKTPELISELIRTLLLDLGTHSDNLQGEISRCYGIADTLKLIRYSSKGSADISLRRFLASDSSSFQPFKYDISVKSSGTEVTTSIPEAAPLYLKELTFIAFDTLSNSLSNLSSS